MLFEEFLLASDVAAVALGKNVFAHRLHGFAGDDARADGCLNGDLEELTGNVLLQFFGDLAGAGVCLVLVNDEGESVHLIAVQEKIELDEFARNIAFEFVVQRRVAAGTAFESVEKVVNDLVERQIVVKFHAGGIEIFHVVEHAAAILTKIHQAAHIVGGGDDACLHHRFVCRVDQVGSGVVRGVVDADKFAVFEFDLIDDARGGGDEIEVEFAFEALFDDLHVKKTEKTAAETEAERHRRFRLEEESGVIEAEFFKRVAQIAVAGAVGGVNARVDHRLNGFETGERRRAGRGGKRDRVAHAGVADALDRSSEIADLAGGERFAFLQTERLHGTDFHHVEFRARVPHTDAVARAETPVHHADVDYHAEITVVAGIEDQRFERGVLVAGRRGNIADGGFEHVLNVESRFRRNGGAILGGDPDDLFNLVAATFDVGGRKVDLVDHGDDFEVRVHSEVGVGKGLGFDALRGVHHQESALAGVQTAGDFVVEVHVTGRVDQVEYIFFAVLRGIIEFDGAGFDGDAAFAFEFHVVEQLVFHVALFHGAGQFEDAVGEGGLAVVDVGDDGEIADMALSCGEF